MYYDLNIPWPQRLSSGIGNSNGGASAGPSKKQKGKQREVPGDASAGRQEKHGAETLSELEKAELRRCTEMAVKLGYSTIAYNVTIPPKAFDSHTIADANPCYRAAPPFPDLDPRTAGEGKKTVLQLSRVTVVLDETGLSGGKGNGSMFTSNNANSLSRYNLISALPVDLASFTAICLNFSQPSSSGIDIIALDLATSARLPFQLKRSLVLTAIANGAVFEVCYGVAMRSAAAASTGPGQNPISKDARRNVIAGARELIRITNGKGVILSSEVRSCMEMRAPLDLCNFGTILGLKPDQAKNTVSNNARLTVLRGHAGRATYRGVVSNPVVVVTTTAPVQNASPAKTKGEVATLAGAKRTSDNEVEGNKASKRKRTAEESANQ